MNRTRRKTSVEWPTVVDDRLRLLVALVQQTETAGSTSASELLSALVCAQPLDRDVLAAQVLRYRSLDHSAVAGLTAEHPINPPRRGRPRRTRPAPRP